jgi:glycosyltransferase involved in cell wall biosynthesis
MFVSEDSSRWIGDSFGLPEQRRVVVHHGIRAEAWKPKRRDAVHPFPYILSVSSIYRAKNFVKLIEAYAELAKLHIDLPDLLIIGDEQDPEYARKMEAARAATGELAEQIHIMGEVAYADVADYYAGAELFVFPSYLETFGHPLLEAMAAEVPVVAADIPVFREIGADAALYADPHSPAALARSMHTALTGFDVRETLVKRGRERVGQFSWERSARGLHALLRSVAAERAPAGVMARAAA